MKIAIIYGSVRSDRQGIKAAHYLKGKLDERSHDTTLVDPMEFQLPLLEKTYKEFDEAPEAMQRLHEIFEESDGFLIVSGEYNHAPPPALLNLIDHFQAEFNFKPSAIAGYSSGTFGGVRAAMVLRQFLPEVGMPTIPSIFAIGKVQEFGEDGTPSDDSYNDRVVRFLDEFEWYLKALKEQRAKGTPY